ncbi:hypothetical protein CASFOL_009682 [Castilleja foliolosa]|uniref:Neprosin PEP catalytic domain-containing protein n=1 Tax=Castilleja foliolosa TaxID=1961234 RepID=A0ABD3DQY3_9LAMI
MFTSNCSYNIVSSVILAFVIFQVFVSSVSSVQSDYNYNNTNQKLRPRDESEKLKHIRDYLNKINKQAVMTIQSPDGDTIDCVLTHQQPAFDHPQLIGQKPMDPPNKMPKWVISSSNKTFKKSFQLWTKSGESCPENTIPIRRTTEQDVLRANSVRTFGRKTVTSDSDSDNHEHAVGLVNSDEYLGAGAIINVWAPYVEELGEFSVSQIWLTAGSPSDQDTIEVGWIVNPQLFGDQLPRLFTYWTSNGYKTGCFNLQCSGFVHICNNIALGAVISPVSSYNGRQYDIPISVYKNRDDSNWWLWVNGNFVGYWPSFLFTHLEDHATMVEFGGEIVNKKSSGTHTSTRMGSVLSQT